MRKSIILLLFLLMTTSALAIEQGWPSTSGSASFWINSSATITTKNIQELTINVSHYPHTTERQKVSQLTTYPEATNFQYYWNKPQDAHLKFGYSARVTTKNFRSEIRNPDIFPVKELSQMHEKYVTSSEIIDNNNPAVQQLANELAQGETQLFPFVVKTASWIEHNIQYSLDTVTAEASQKASWVLENRRGVCDELTNLFIAIMRAQNIPARFISGYAYTSTDPDNLQYGPHGWAEVYLSSTGWVPVDITYQQIGWLDLGHIEFQEGVDSNKPAVSYSWTGEGMTPEPLNTQIQMEQADSAKEEDLLVSALPKIPKVGFGSYDAIEVTITNPHDYYVSTTANIVTSDSIKLHEKSKRIILLEPKETKRESWLFSITKDLDPDLVYKTSFVVDIEGITRTPAVITAVDYPTYDESAFPKERSKTFSKLPIEINCNAKDGIIYIDEHQSVTCIITNKYQSELTIDLCFESCATLSLAPEETTTETFVFNPSRAGPQDAKISASTKDATLIATAPYTVLPKATVRVEYIAPDTVEWTNTIPLNITLDSTTDPVRNLTFSLLINNKEIEKQMLPLLIKRKYQINIPAKLLNSGNNTIKLDFAYVDRKSRLNEQVETYNIELVNLRFYHYPIIWLRNIKDKLLGPLA